MGFEDLIGVAPTLFSPLEDFEKKSSEKVNGRR